jgi:tight adherence protein B
MTLLLLAVAMFASTLGLVWNCLYFFVEKPLARRRMMTRLAAVQEVSSRSDEQADVLRKDLLSDLPWLNQTLAFMPGIPRLRLFLDQAGVRMQLGTFVLTVVSLPLFVMVAFIVLGLPGIYCALASVGSVLLPFAVVGARRVRRLKKFEEQFPECIDLLGRSIRAGHAFTTGFEMIGKELPDPVGEEFRIAYGQQNLGLPLRDALGNMAVRVPLADVRIFVSALQIQRESGGNLAEILDTLSEVIRERFKLQRQIRIFTAEGRLSLYMLSGIPIVTAIGLSIFMPGYLRPMLTDPAGHIAIAVVIALQVIGYFVINRIIKIKV